MRIRLTKVLTAVVCASLSACVDTPIKPDESPRPHIDIAYDQFKLSVDGKSPYDLSAYPAVPAECGAKVPEEGPQAGGVAIMATVVTKLIGLAASAIVNELKKWVDAEVAKYSSDITGKPTRVGFYASQRWFAKKNDTAQYSCFIITLHRCDAAHVDKDKGLCETEAVDSRVLIVGQFKLTAEDLQVRPLFGQVRGFEATRSSTPEASIAATLKFQSIWWDGHEGHTEAPMTANVLSVKFKPTSGDPGDLGIDLAVQHKISTPGQKPKYAFANWDSLPLLPRPPQSPGTDGTMSVTPSIAETNTPPEALTLIKKVLGDNSSQISDALKNALQSLVPTK